MPRPTDLLRLVPRPLRVVPLAALPVAFVAAMVDLTGAGEVRYSPPPPDDDEQSWVVARTDGSDPAGCQLTVQVMRDGTAADDAALRLVRATADGAADVWTAVANQNGGHRFVDLQAGAYHLTATAPGAAPGSAPVFVCQGDGSRNFAAVPLMSEAQPELHGRVSGPDKRAIAGAEISLQQEDDARTALAGVLRVPVRPDGTFAVRLAPGRYVAQLTAPHHAPQLRKLTIGTDAAKAELKAVLQPAPHVSGQVVDEEGRPLAHAVVALGGALDPKAKAVRVTADAEGRFSLPVRMDMRPALTARAGDRIARVELGAVSRPLGITDVTLVATAGRAVEGVVTRPDGSTVAYQSVRFRVRELGLTGTEVADERGRFVLEGMPADIDVEVWAEGNATGAWGAQVAAVGARDQLALVYIAPAY